jgi:hypothetical protein
MSQVLQQVVTTTTTTTTNDFKLIQKFDMNNVPKAKTLDELVEQLHQVFEHDSINVEYVKELLRNYDSNPKEWSKYAKYDPYK